MDKASYCAVLIWQKVCDDGEVSRNLLSGFVEDANCRLFLFPFVHTIFVSITDFDNLADLLVGTIATITSIFI